MPIFSLPRNLYEIHVSQAYGNDIIMSDIGLDTALCNLALRRVIHVSDLGYWDELYESDLVTHGVWLRRNFHRMLTRTSR